MIFFVVCCSLYQSSLWWPNLKISKLYAVNGLAPIRHLFIVLVLVGFQIKDVTKVAIIFLMPRKEQVVVRSKCKSSFTRHISHFTAKNSINFTTHKALLYLSVILCRLEPKDLEGTQVVNLRYVKFQNVQNIQVFIKDNQSGGEVTQLDYIGFIGSPIITTKMEDFKRIAGKKGESH